jgi:21S rRNA (GM2251-2'-O)-methyltransferase
LYVDGVLDEGNLGAIARSAYVLGVDALVTPSRQSAPWSHIALKASAGAAEAVPIFKVDSPADFLGKSARAGWRIYASDAIPAAPATSTPPSTPSSSSSSISASSSLDPAAAANDTPTQDDSAVAAVVYTFARSPKRLPAGHSPVAEHPTILMMGAEGSGLRTSLLNLAHYKVGIQQGRATDEVGVDSLNVSVAASLLCFEALKKPVERVRDEAEVLF